MFHSSNSDDARIAASEKQSCSDIRLSSSLFYQALHIITPLSFGGRADCRPEVLLSPQTKALDPFPRDTGEPARRINAVAKLALSDKLINHRADYVFDSS